MQFGLNAQSAHILTVIANQIKKEMKNMFDLIKQKHDEEVLDGYPGIDLNIVPIKITKEDAKKIKIKEIPILKREIAIGFKVDNIFYFDIPHSIFRDKNGVYSRIYITIEKKNWLFILTGYSHLELIKRALEVRMIEKKDITTIKLTDSEEEVKLTFKVLQSTEVSLFNFYENLQKIINWTNKIGHNFQDQISKIHLNHINKFNPYNLFELPELIEQIRSVKTANEKGKILEEIIVKLFLEISGFEINSRVKNSSEEIDIMIKNKSKNRPWKNESNIIIIECKNWTSKCGSKELRDFAGKVENRRSRCKIGFFISWNGFTKGYRDELLRYSKTDILIVPLTGKKIKESINNNNDIVSSIEKWYNNAITDKNK